MSPETFDADSERRSNPSNTQIILGFIALALIFGEWVS
jgi:hypothetical protein